MPAPSAASPSPSNKPEDQPPVLSLDRITKRFDDVVANDAISLELKAGEVLGLLGENGAGKSTLMNVLSGLIRPDEGTVRIGGQQVDVTSPRDATALGIGMVHQHFKLVPTLTVAENIALGDASLRALPLDLESVREKLSTLSEKYGLPIDPDERISDLSVSGQQRVEILKALSRHPRILILDEPTAVLADEEAEGLFEAVRSLTASGIAVILISHRLNDIFAVCDRVTVLRRGRVVLAAETADLDRESLVEAMVGEAVTLPTADRSHEVGDPVLQLKGIRLERDNGSIAAAEVNLDVRAGEIVGIAGVDGNGQTELTELIAGLRAASKGEILFNRGPLGAKPNPMALRRQGLRLIPGDRHAAGVLVEKPLSENHLLSNLHAKRFNRRGWLFRRQARQDTATAIDKFDVRAPGTGAAMGQLSGGNQQKMVLARELADGARLLVAAHPTRGLDVRTIAFIEKQFLALRDAGVGILLVSADLSEIWRLADRILVIGGGNAYGPVPLGETSRQQVGAWMAGHD